MLENNHLLVNALFANVAADRKTVARDAPAFPSQKGIKLVRTTVGKDWLLWAIFVLIALTTAWTKSEIVWLFVLCGIIGVLVKAPLQIQKGLRR